MTNESNDASAPLLSPVSVGDAATRENAGVEASLSPDVVERVARALLHCDHQDGWADQAETPFELLPKHTRRIYLGRAKAAIAAMKEGV